MKNIDYLKELRQIESNVFYNMDKTSQIVIDLIQTLTVDLDRDYEEEPIERDELGAINYDIGVLIEVYNLDLKFDIETLTKIDKIIERWYEDIENVNIALGIPRHRG